MLVAYRADVYPNDNTRSALPRILRPFGSSGLAGTTMLSTHTITDTHGVVATIKIQLQALQNDIAGIKQQQSMEQSLNQVGLAPHPAPVNQRRPHPTKHPRRQ